MIKRILLTIWLCLLPLVSFGAFPTTSVIDNFDRSNEGPPPSASWTTTASEGFKVVSNALKPDVAFADTYYNTSFGPDMEAYVTITTKESDGNSLVLGVRFNPANSNTYYLLVSSDAGTDTIELRKWTGTGASLATAFSQEISSGDSVGLSAVGTSICAHYKAAAGSWTQLGCATDATYDGTGSNVKIEIYTDSTTPVYDDFGGGTVVASSRRVLVVQ